MPLVLTKGLSVPARASPKACGRGHVGGDRGLHVAGRHQVVLEGEVDDAVGVRRGLLQAVEVVEVAAPHLGAGRLELRGGLIGAGEADDLVARLEQLGDDGGADVAGRAGDEYAHGKPPSSWVDIGPVAGLDVTVCHQLARVMSRGVITTIVSMGRWAPDAQGRLAVAAMELFDERGFEATTVADIAERAGLTKRTFFRYFGDKREVLFAGTEVLQEGFVAGDRRRPRRRLPLDAIAAGLDAMADSSPRSDERPRKRQAIIAANPELQERELIKLSGYAAAGAAALRERGVAEPGATLAAEAGHGRPADRLRGVDERA